MQEGTRGLSFTMAGELAPKNSMQVALTSHVLYFQQHVQEGPQAEFDLHVHDVVFPQ